MKKIIFILPVMVLSFLPVGCGNSGGSATGLGPSTSYSKTGNFTPADGAFFGDCKLKEAITKDDKTEFTFQPSRLKILSISTEDLMGCPASVLLTNPDGDDTSGKLIWIANFDQSDDFTNDKGQKTRTCEYNYLSGQNDYGGAFFNSLKCTKKIVQ